MRTALAIALWAVLGGCAHERACPPARAPAHGAWALGGDERVCDSWPVDIAFTFPCGDASLDPGPPHAGAFDHDAALDALLELTRSTPGVVGVMLLGSASSEEAEDRSAPSLAQRRADAVARALARRGYPPERIVPLVAGPASAPVPDACPGRDRDHPSRRVAVELIRCMSPRDYHYTAFGRYELD